MKLSKAGATIEEVFNGMKDGRDWKWITEGGWDIEDYPFETCDLELYLPDYERDPEGGHWILDHEIPEPPETILEMP
jgi:hypothetical protein